MSLALLIACSLVPFLEAAQSEYAAVNGLLCVRSEFTVTVRAGVTDISCAMLCTARQNCQAFTVADGPCQLFVFNACSRSVRDCNCTRRGQVFVRQQPGLQPGALCPPDFGDNLCGVKYKVSSSPGTWQAQQTSCAAESGSLVIFADVNDAAEMAHIDMLFTKYSKPFYLGAHQNSGSSEPAGGWFWVACGTAVDPALWGAGEPDNGNGGNAENVVVRVSAHTMLADVSEIAVTPYGMCECVAPFD